VSTVFAPVLCICANRGEAVVLNLNPFFLLEDDPTPARDNQLTRAASLVVSALSFVRAVRKEELPPDTMRGTPLCMYQYSRLFGTARVPTENGCQIVQDPDAKHMVVLCRGQFYWFDVLDDNSDLIMTEKDLAVNLQVVVDDAEQTPIQEAAKGALGVLSTENRKVWAGLRDVLTRDEGSNNADCLGIVDSALFILCLDYTEPQTGPQLCTNMLCGTNEVVKGIQIGTCTNRWYDKLQIIVCKNGSAGINFEHTGVDGHTVLRMASDVYTDTILRFAKSINGEAPSLWTSTSPDPAKRDPSSFGDVSTTPHKLEWDMLPELSTALRFAETRLADLIQQNEFQVLEFGGYGKNFMTSMGFSPDAFVQMAFQAAYYGLYGRVECIYEPAMTKVYLHGRTEAVRPVTADSVEFVKTFWAENPPHQKVEALRVATQKHTAMTKECAKAQGHDRHLYALYSVWQRALDEEGAEAASSNGFSSNGYSSPVEADLEQDPTSNGESPKRESIVSADGSASGSTNGRHVPHQMPAIFADGGWDKINNTAVTHLCAISVSVPLRATASELGTSLKTTQSPSALLPSTDKPSVSSTLSNHTCLRLGNCCDRRSEKLRQTTPAVHEKLKHDLLLADVSRLEAGPSKGRLERVTRRRSRTRRKATMRVWVDVSIRQRFPVNAFRSPPSPSLSLSVRFSRSVSSSLAHTLHSPSSSPKKTTH